MNLHKKLISYAFDGFYEFVNKVSYRDLFLIKIRHSFLVIEAYLGERETLMYEYGVT